MNASTGATIHAGPVSVRFLVEAFHRKDGRRLWQYAVDAEGVMPDVHQKHNLASPSPVTPRKWRRVTEPFL